MKNIKIGLNIKTLLLDILLTMILGGTMLVLMLLTKGYTAEQLSDPSMTYSFGENLFALLLGLFGSFFACHKYMVPRLKKDEIVVNLKTYITLVMIFGVVMILAGYDSGYAWLDVIGIAMYPLVGALVFRLNK